MSTMNKSDVFFKSVDRIGANETQVDQVTDLFPHISPVHKGDIVAVKIHPGEYGNTTQTRPVIARTVVDMVRDTGGIPFNSVLRIVWQILNIIFYNANI